MTPLDRLTCLELTDCIARHLEHMERDGLANSLSHWQKIVEDNRMLSALMGGEDVELLVHL